ncbi:MAG: HAD family hydrolase [Methylotenera sp.]|nr:HAD family hydrolase [Oligoflexia bacterium]
MKSVCSFAFLFALSSLATLPMDFGSLEILGTSVAQASATQPVLNGILAAVQSQVSAGQIPVVLFDLDDTLFDSRSRTLPILLKFSSDPAMKARYPEETAVLSRLQLWDVHYDLATTLHVQGIDRADFSQQLSDFWTLHFFSNECENDHVIPLAPEYVRTLAQAGARIVYLTGRDRIRMGVGTRKALQGRGFPTRGLTLLLMKPNAQVADLEFKLSAFKWIGTQGKVVAVFENEPANLNAMKRAFPEAQSVFVDSIRSSRPEMPAAGTVWIRSFQ